jgi:hypothetical protein
MKPIGLALVCLAAGTAPALAQIRIDEARIVAGDLRVSGRAKPNTVITFDERHETRSTNGGFFTFRLQYLPSDCVGTLKAARRAGTLSSQTAALSALQVLLVPQDRRGTQVRKASLVLLDQPAPQDRQVQRATRGIGASPGQLDRLEQQGLQERGASRDLLDLQAHRGSGVPQDLKGSGDLPGLQGPRVHRGPLDREASRDQQGLPDHGVNQVPPALLDPLDRPDPLRVPILSKASQALRA